VNLAYHSPPHQFHLISSIIKVASSFAYSDISIAFLFMELPKLHHLLLDSIKHHSISWVHQLQLDPPKMLPFYVSAYYIFDPGILLFQVAHHFPI